jgi:hypothetical protein
MGFERAPSVKYRTTGAPVPSGPAGAGGQILPFAVGVAIAAVLEPLVAAARDDGIFCRLTRRFHPG